MPANTTFEQATPSTECSHYALSYIRAAKIRSGQHVLVNGATGAIGSAAIQLMKSLGARATAVCGVPHAEVVGGLGADRVIDNTAEDFTKDEQAHDVVFDAVGKSTRRSRSSGVLWCTHRLARGKAPLKARGDDATARDRNRAGEMPDWERRARARRRTGQPASRLRHAVRAVSRPGNLTDVARCRAQDGPWHGTPDIPAPSVPSVRFSVSSVLPVRSVHGAVVMVRRRSTVRFRNGAPVHG